MNFLNSDMAEVEGEPNRPVGSEARGIQNASTRFSFQKLISREL